MRRALPHADHLLAASENTAADVRRYVKAQQLPEPPITVTRYGSSFAEFLPVADAPGDLGPEEIPERFVLFVATIEGRKNHKLMLDIWRRMIADGEDPPHLVCVGRPGWKSSAFLYTLVETGYLDGRVHLLHDLSDADLEILYRECLFTVFPSFYEGWGLPVSESLAVGKICVCSDRASLPEVAGEFGVYIDIADFEQSLKVIRGLISDAAARRKLEAKIRRGYRPITWRSVAEDVLKACLAAPRIRWREPYPFTAVPYSAEISFAQLDRNLDGTGKLLLERIKSARRGHFLSEPLREENFLWGEEARSAGRWSYPEDWGTWACGSGGEIAVALPGSPSLHHHVLLRLRASGPVMERPVRISADGEPVWEGALGRHSRDLSLRVPGKPGDGGWRLSLRAQIDLTPELCSQIAAQDGRIPTIGFERMIVVPEDDLKTRVEIMQSLLFSR